MLTIQISVSKIPSYAFINIENFIFPISYLASWPAIGGMNLTLSNSLGIEKGRISNVKISGINSGSVTSIVINHDSSKPNVGEINVTLFFSVSVPHSIPVNGIMTIFFPTQPVTGDDVVVNPICSQSGGTMAEGLICSYSSSTQLVTLTNFITIASSGIFNFTITGVKNPISTEKVTGIAIGKNF